MPDKNKDKKKNSGQKKSGVSSLWIVGVVIIFLVAVMVGLLLASASRPLGALAFLVLFSISYLIVPKNSRRLFWLALISLIIAMTLLTVVWELWGTEASANLDPPSIFALVFLLFGTAFLVGFGIVAFSIVMGTSFIIPWVQSVSGHAGMETGELRKFLIRSYLGVSPSYLVFSGDKIVAESPKGILPQFGGPGLAIIKPETAVVFEHLGSVSRIQGPGTLKDIKMFELPKAVVDLRPQWDTTGEFKVSTQDGETVKLCVRYRTSVDKAPDAPASNIEPKAVTGTETNGSGDHEQQADQGQAGKDGKLIGAPLYLADTVQKVVYDCGTKGWKEETRDTVRAAVHAVFQAYTVDTLFPALTGLGVDSSRPLQEALAEAELQADEIARDWGMKVDRLSVESITPPEVVTDGTRVLRRGRIDAETLAAAGVAEAHVYAGLQTMEAQAQEAKLRILIRQVTSTIDDLPDEHVIAFFNLVEQLAKIINSNRAVDYRYIKALEALSENPNARIIIQPGSNGIIVENIVD